jgi:hypothetical protein
MTSSEKYCMKVNDFDANLVNSLSELKDSEEFFDVTLVSDDETPFRAHKVILSASSPFFRNVLKFNQNNFPLLYIRGLTSKDLANVVEFLYRGEVTVAHEDLDQFLKVSRDLKLKGMYENEEVNKYDTDESLMKEEVKKRKKKNKRTPLVKVEDKNMEDKDDVQIEVYSFQEADVVTEEPTSDVESKVISSLDTKISEMMFREDKMWHCKKCGETKRRKSNIQQHIEINHLDASQPCTLCDVVSKNRPSFYHHMKTKHSHN